MSFLLYLAWDGSGEQPKSLGTSIHMVAGEGLQLPASDGIGCVHRGQLKSRLADGEPLPMFFLLSL